MQLPVGRREAAQQTGSRRPVTRHEGVLQAADQARLAGGHVGRGTAPDPGELGGC